MPEWVHLQVITHIEAADAITYHLDEMGAASVSSMQQDGHVGTTRVTVNAYFPPDNGLGERALAIRKKLEDLEEFGLRTAPARVALNTVEVDDWESAWKAFFKPRQYGAVMVTPSWEPIPDEAPEAVVVLDPGLAFGTGSHASTRLCLQELAGLPLRDARVADIGTGSGILTIAAVKLGARWVHAVDVDDRAVKVAAENVAANGVGDRVRIGIGTIDELAGPFDVVLMNILADVIIEALPKVTENLAPGGRAVFSGITEFEADRVAAALDAEGFEQISVPSLEGWTAFVASRPESPTDIETTEGHRT